MPAQQGDATPEELQVLSSPVVAPRSQADTRDALSVTPDGTYRVQVGSFRVPRNAVDTFTRLSASNFAPSYERSGEFFRVVLSGIRGTEVQSTVDRLATMGFYDVLIAID
jgi:hypothetical protein